METKKSSIDMSNSDQDAGHAERTGDAISHITSLELEIKDLASLQAACKRLGWEFAEGQDTYSWYGTFVGDEPLPADTTVEELGHCEHAIKVPGCEYEIGVVRKANRWILRWDYWSSGGLQAVLGSNGGIIKQAYGIEHSRRVLVKQGYRVIGEQRLADGSVRLRVEA